MVGPHLYTRCLDFPGSWRLLWSTVLSCQTHGRWYSRFVPVDDVILCVDVIWIADLFCSDCDCCLVAYFWCIFAITVIRLLSGVFIVRTHTASCKHILLFSMFTLSFQLINRFLISVKSHSRGDSVSFVHSCQCFWQTLDVWNNHWCIVFFLFQCELFSFSSIFRPPVPT